jgi:hypothetical protein
VSKRRVHKKSRPLDAIIQQLVDAPGGMILQARQHIGQPGLRIRVVELGGLDNENAA